MRVDNIRLHGVPSFDGTTDDPSEVSRWLSKVFVHAQSNGLTDEATVRLLVQGSSKAASDYIEQHAAFPNAAHDDMVDQSSQAVDRLILRPLLDHTSTIGSFADYFDSNQIINY